MTVDALKDMVDRKCPRICVMFDTEVDKTPISEKVTMEHASVIFRGLKHAENTAEARKHMKELRDKVI